MNSLKFIKHERNGQIITEVVSEGLLINNADEAFQLMMDISYSGSHKIVFHKSSITESFFDLKTGLAGEILQKAVNYRLEIAIVGDFENIKSESLKAFIFESNRGRHGYFVKDVDAALSSLSKQSTVK